MKASRAAFLFLLCFEIALCAGRAAAADENVGEQLQSQYLNKVLTLRHFYEGDHLSFAPDGSLINAGQIGPWTVSGQVFVKSVELRPHSLQIEGRRVCLVFDYKTKSLIDAQDYLESALRAQDMAKRKKKDRGKGETLGWDKMMDNFRNRNVEIEIAMAAESASVQEASTALNAVFLRPEESLADIVPDFWQDYLDRIEGRPPRVRQTADVEYRVTPGVVSPPRVIYSPEPEFSQDARMTKFQGQVTLSVVVDASGRTTEIQIVSPLGMGLDEKAVDAVRNWTFQPARKGGKPVSVKIAIEVDFHLN